MFGVLALTKEFDLRLLSYLMWYSALGVIHKPCGQGRVKGGLPNVHIIYYLQALFSKMVHEEGSKTVHMVIGLWTTPCDF